MVLKASEGSGFSIPLTRAVGEQQCCAGDPSHQTVFFPGAASPTGALTDVSHPLCQHTPTTSKWSDISDAGKLLIGGV